MTALWQLVTALVAPFLLFSLSTSSPSFLDIPLQRERPYPKSVLRVSARTRDDSDRLTLSYSHAFDPPSEPVPMLRDKDGSYSGSIPTPEEGQLLRYTVAAIDVNGNTTTSTGGTVVTHAAEEGSTNLPILHLFLENAADLEPARAGARTRAVVFYDDELFNDVAVRRRGQTSLRWPKPKLKLSFPGRDFPWPDGERRRRVNLNSFFEEMGEDSYLREPLAAAVLAAEGVTVSRVEHIHLRLNGNFYGLYALVEQVDDQFLRRRGLPDGTLFKSTHGELSNLRYDVPRDELHWAYKKGNRKNVQSDWDLLKVKFGRETWLIPTPDSS